MISLVRKGQLAQVTRHPVFKSYEGSPQCPWVQLPIQSCPIQEVQLPIQSCPIQEVQTEFVTFFTNIYLVFYFIFKKGKIIFLHFRDFINHLVVSLVLSLKVIFRRYFSSTRIATGRIF